MNRIRPLLAVVLVAMCAAPNKVSGQASMTISAAMSPQQYAASGLASLSPTQRTVIDDWFNDWTKAAISVSCGGTYANTREKQSIEENADGKILVLDDNSLWLVDSVDQVDSALWLSTEDVTVIEAKRPVGTFKYTIINTEENGEKVSARYLGQE